VHAAASAR